MDQSAVQFVGQVQFCFSLTLYLTTLQSKLTNVLVSTVARMQVIIIQVVVISVL